MKKKMRNVLKTAVAINAAFAMLMTFSGGIDKMAYASDVTGQFEFSNAGITVTNTSSGYSIADTALTITASGTYIVTGSCDEGSIVIKKGTTGVNLVLKDLLMAEPLPLMPVMMEFMRKFLS